jgi:hypothetical protein
MIIEVANFDMTIIAGTKIPLRWKRRAREHCVGDFCSESFW